VLADAFDDARAIRAKPKGELGTAYTAHHTVDGVTLTMVAPYTLSAGSRNAIVWFTASGQPNDLLDLTAWISLLIAQTKNPRLTSALVFGNTDTKDALTRLAIVGDAADAGSTLEKLVGIWRETRERVVPLFPKLSRKLVEKADEEMALIDLLNVCRAEWEGGFEKRGAAQDAWVSMLYGDRGVEELESLAPEILTKARAVWDGVVAAKNAYASLVASTSAAPAESDSAASTDSGEGEPDVAKKRTRKPREKKA
jgi:exonuclease V gamma subunit